MDIHDFRTSKPFISSNSKDNDQPRKVNLTSPSMNNSGTLRKENSVCPHAGVHRTCLTITESFIEEKDFSLQVIKEWMALWPVDHAASVDTSKSPRTAPTDRLGSNVTMFNHGSRSKESTDSGILPQQSWDPCGPTLSLDGWVSETPSPYPPLKLSRLSYASGSISMVRAIRQASKNCIPGRMRVRIGTAICQCLKTGEKGSVSLFSGINAAQCPQQQLVSVLVWQ